MVFSDLPEISPIQPNILDLNSDVQPVTECVIPELGGIWGNTCNCGE